MKGLNTHTTICVFAMCFLLLDFGSSAAQTPLELKTANGHPMMYYVSLPQGWTSSKSWPVVFVLEAADKEFEANARRFVAARGSMPFIIVAPVNTNNGNQGRRDPAVFPYSKENWDYIDKVGDCEFNAAGVRQIMLDVQKAFHAEDKIYITGFEAGTHDLWSIVLNHPEYLKAAAPVAGNFRNRCTTSLNSTATEQKKNLPIRSFVGAKDQYFGPSGSNYNQWVDVKKLANTNGFQNISESVIPDADHVPMPAEVMNYFNSMLK